MRKLLLLLLLSPLLSFSQKPLSYSDVIQVDSASKEVLFTRVRAWMNDVFNSSKDVIQYSDKESGELSGKGNMVTPVTYHYIGKHTVSMRTKFAINLWVKDNKCKYEIKNFESSFDENDASIGLLTDEISYNGPKMSIGKKTMDEIWIVTKQEVAQRTEELIKSLNDALKKGKTDF